MGPYLYSQYISYVTIFFARFKVCCFQLVKPASCNFWRNRNRYHKTRFVNTQKLRKPVPTSVWKPKLAQCELPKLIWPSGPERKSWNWSVTTWTKLTDCSFRELTETNSLGRTNCLNEKSNLLTVRMKEDFQGFG